MRSTVVALPFLVALLIAASGNCLASDFVHHNEGVGINLGLMLSDITNDAGDPRLGLSIGTFWSYAFSRSVSLHSELSFTQRGDADLHLSYIELAVLPRYHVRSDGPRRLSVYAGPMAGYQVQEDLRDSEDYNYVYDIENFKYGLGAGVMWDIDREHSSTILDLRYTRSLNDLRDSVPGGKNHALMLAVAISSGSRRARAEHAIEHRTMEYQLAESSTGAKPGVAQVEAERKVRADLEDGTRVVGGFVRLESDTLVMSNAQFLERTEPKSSRHSKDRGNPHFEVVDQEASARVPMTVVEELYVHKGQAKKGAAIGALVGLTLGGAMALTSDDDFGGGVIGGGFVAVVLPIVGAIVGGIDHWVAIHPSD